MEAHPYISLAFNSIRHFLNSGHLLPCPDLLSGELSQKKGVFVSLKKNGQLRGCIGSLTPQHDSLAVEIIQNAVKAASKDPRFDAIAADELDELSISIDVLSPLEKIDDPAQLDCKQFGLAVRYEDKQGVLLPNLDGIDTVEEQLRVCLKKAGIDPGAAYEMHRFLVHRYR